MTNTKAAGFTHESPKSQSISWYTPPEIFDALDLIYDLDPCSPGLDASFVPAISCYTEADDGLTSPWHGLCWVNPPYDNTRAWLQKLADHGDGIALVFARTDTTWFHEAAARADVVCFISGRIRFYKGSTRLSAPSRSRSSLSASTSPEISARCHASMVAARRSRVVPLRAVSSLMYSARPSGPRLAYSSTAGTRATTWRSSSARSALSAAWKCSPSSVS
ncbi:DNA N-6-adenine-methyltransferase [Curtobacterium sp. MCBD17_040]|uniref:DNA N-6-adenine-methyltransferase n=1 Tax=Curtobacterium sp. MCBD17_040 TaxID=2175674 RepID=UPI000DAA22DB|nr:DNA N-6-adenine-methyltransferase [Curtobacterium sp. MCBD17_040]WIB65620.1 DNA N-6-adenine-methyltransferase [Curtobacterium sp. MCBD17_040]